ncbi:MAG: hypothetical protein SAJ37_05125 [Oscillatoria sp. PMC 1068.18]|nr:hypothetical protein [Oscillatoria sp. PMC 1076.18]MEC4988112.1 hypothetical protein [Oscillatoria sp. PMC 1068.18]
MTTNSDNSRLDRIEANIEANTHALAELMEAQRMLVQMFAQEQDAMRDFRQTTNRTLDRLERVQLENERRFAESDRRFDEQSRRFDEQNQHIITLQQQVATMLDYLFRQRNNGDQ